MKKYAVVFLSLALILISACGNATEWRALWIDGWHSGMWTHAQIDTMLTNAQTGHYNVIVPQIRKKADALYISHYGGPDGTGEPMYSGVESGLDPLAYMIQQAHAVGIQVHPWVCTHRCPSTAGTTPEDWFYTSHNNWLTKDSGGNLVFAEGYYLDPGVPDGEEYTVNVMLDIVSHYDIDGIQWDRIRYPGSNSGYNTIAYNRYLAECAEVNPDPSFSAWRRWQLNDFVARVYAQIMEIKPNIAVGVNSWAYTTDGVGVYFQDVPTWMANHWLDVDVPMNYTTTNSSFNSYLTTHLYNRNGRYVFSGHNVGTNTQANAVIQIGNARTLNTSKGCPWGEQCYSYYHGTVTVPGWFTYVSASSSRPYYNTDTVPTMPWKTSPTQGIILGRIVDAAHPNDPVYHDWINRATVTLYHAGPPEINRTTETDQTGYFVFTDVDPKTQSSAYTITITKSGFASRSIPAQAIAAGQVLRIDAELGTWTASSPSSTIPRGGLSLISIPHEPVDPDPVVVMGSIPIDGRLTRWDRPGQGSVTYDENDQDYFGDLSLDQGYWLTTSSAQTISYQAYGKTTASRSQSLPKAGWSIIGCIYDTETPWANMTVTNGTTTVSLEQAMNNGWVNSIGFWWDAQGQGTRDVGLPDDACYTDNLQPWHGTWFRTFVDNLSLTQR